MTAHLLIADTIGLLLAVSGFTLAFRQAFVRAVIDRRRAMRGLPPLKAADGPEDPLHYALIISGTMLLAFGIILFGFTTMYALAA